MEMTFELKAIVQEISVTEVIRTIKDMGAELIGGYAEMDSRYGKGAKYMGGSLIRLGSVYFLLLLDEKSSMPVLKQIDLGENIVAASEMAVTITGLLNGEKVLFKNKDDAIEWLTTMASDRKRKDLTVKAPDYIGSAFMYI